MRKWYGNQEYVVSWSCSPGFNRAKTTMTRAYLKPCITWSDIPGNSFAGHYHEGGFVFDVKGSCAFAEKTKLQPLIGIFNSKVTPIYVEALNPTTMTQAGDLKRIPSVEPRQSEVGHIQSKVMGSVDLSKVERDSFESSWDFREYLLFRSVSTISKTFNQWNTKCDDRSNRLEVNEEGLNRIFTDIYGLQNELTPEVEDRDVTMCKADLQRDIKSLLGYAAGCMFGRYSLNTEGLAYVDGAWDSSKYRRFIPDEDNVIPIANGEYLEDDIVSRPLAWLKVAYGVNTLEENLDFIAKALGTKGSTSREIIHNYLLNDLLKDHCQAYSVTGSGRCLIYWLSDSGKQNGFKAPIYLHRYTPDTIDNLRIDYLRKMRRVYESEINRIQNMMEHSKNAREVVTAGKRKEKPTKRLEECREYDEKISHLVFSRIELDLDDGIKVNYRKLQAVQDGKLYEVLSDSKNIMIKQRGKA